MFIRKASRLFRVENNNRGCARNASKAKGYFATPTRGSRVASGIKLIVRFVCREPRFSTIVYNGYYVTAVTKLTFCIYRARRTTSPCISFSITSTTPSPTLLIVSRPSRPTIYSEFIRFLDIQITVSTRYYPMNLKKIGSIVRGGMNEKPLNA